MHESHAKSILEEAKSEERKTQQIVSEFKENVESKLSKEIKTEVLIAKNDLNKALKARIEAEQLPDSDPQKI